MTDDEIERTLHQYVPAAPPSSLRARVVSAADRPGDRWMWIAAAAMAVVALGVHQLATRTIEAVDRPSNAATTAMTPDWLTQFIGDDAYARERFSESMDVQSARDTGSARDRAVVEATWIH